MRENMGLYRGKRIDNGEWVEGFLVVVGKWYYILTGKLDITKGVVAFEGFVVISETVGQFTGLTDKNDVRIFEGDIHEIDGHCFAVKYGKFKSNADSRYGWYFEAIKCGATEEFYGDEEKYVNIIGNIHDNPELLEVSSDG